MIIPWTPILEGRSAACGTHGCKCCRSMSRKNKIFSTTNHKGFFTAKHSNCCSNNVIYLLECKKCDKCNQYVGQTQRLLSQRVAGHRASHTKKTHLPIYQKQVMTLSETSQSLFLKRLPHPNYWPGRAIGLTRSRLCIQKDSTADSN